MDEFRSAAGWASGDREPTLPLRRVPQTGKTVGVCTTHAVVEKLTHWIGSKTVGCVAPRPCIGCQKKVGLKYEAYVGLYHPSTQSHVIQVLTLGAVRQMLDTLGRIDQVRGLTLTLFRKGKEKNSRVVAQCGMIHSDRQGLPPPFDVVAHLRRIWGIEYLQTLADMAEAEKSAAQNFVDEAIGDIGFIKRPETLAEQMPKGELDGQVHLPDMRWD